MDKVLIGVVTYEGKNYCFDQFKKFLSSITYPHVDIIFVDNSATPNNRNMLIRHGYNAVWLRKGKTEQEIMANCNEWLREYTLKHKYSHLLNLESDIIPYPNFLEIMLSYEKPVIGLPYFIGQSFMSYVLQFDQETTGFYRALIPMSNAKSLFLASGKLRKSHQIGLGCLLMSRQALKLVKFELLNDILMYHADSSLHVQLQQLNIPVYLCCDDYCRHLNKSKFHNRLFTADDFKESGKYKDIEDNIPG